ncbi:SCO family protein [Halobiforma nitratireducens]|uniref:Electron transport protein SCO1/SenC n=1 Tax=Halobiforma nitratireducens JCM 10879 TaxID=1227454 RepID=M0LSP9_9EURY|nr:SCO family protein [Halobiforma nitratireducens]EMA35125.1 electron transport protein SCO1/SenC [Halobiforma nitratireducens JCM 10879]
MERRTYLRSLGAAGTVGVAGLAGCLGDSLGAVGGGDDGDDGDGQTEQWGDGPTVLDPPELNRGAASHPIHGQEFPEFTLPDPIAGEPVSLEDFVGERSFLMTYIFTECPDGACPALMTYLQRVQADAVEHGYADDLALLAMTFDPERDDADALAEYAAQQGVDHAADNWHFLRPDSYEEGKEILHDDFGMRIERVESDELEDHGDHDHDDDHYSFIHINLILLANEDGVVERSYPRALNEEAGGGPDTVLEDTRAVVAEQTDFDPNEEG